MIDETGAMPRRPLSRSRWRLHQAILWTIALGGGGGLIWWIDTTTWPWLVKDILSFGVACSFIVGGPSTYRAYLRGEAERDDYADLLGSGRGTVLSKCRGCGRHTYLEEPFCVRCGIADPVPDAEAGIQSARFLMWIGYTVMAAVLVTIVYLLVRALV